MAEVLLFSSHLHIHLHSVLCFQVETWLALLEDTDGF